MGGDDFQSSEDDAAEVEFILVEVGPFVERGGGLPGREAVPNRIVDPNQAITGQWVRKELPASLTVPRRVGFTTALRNGAFREIVTVIVAFARKSTRFSPKPAGDGEAKGSAGEKNTRLMQRAKLAQVWMDHICFQPAAASGFRLTLKDGAEPSLGTPGPE